MAQTSVNEAVARQLSGAAFCHKRQLWRGSKLAAAVAAPRAHHQRRRRVARGIIGDIIGESARIYGSVLLACAA